MQKVMQNYKLSKKIKTSFLTSILAIGICISPFAFAENPLVTQAKELQTGSEKVGINHQKAIALLKKASDEGDAEAMYLLSQYYSVAADYRYLPVNNSLYRKLRINSASQGNSEAYLNLQFEKNILNSMGINNSLNQDFAGIDSKVINLAQNGNAEAMHTMVWVLDNNNSDEYSFKQCQWLYKAIQHGDTFNSVYHIQNCSNKILEKLGAKSSEEYRKDYIEMELEQYKSIQKLIKQGSILAKFKMLKEFSKSELLSESEKQRLRDDVINFYKTQASNEISDAYLKLALSLESETEKHKMYEKSAQLNNYVALTEMGYYYLFNENPKYRDETKGINYLEKSANQNDPEALNYLGVWYRDTTNSQRDLTKSDNYFKKAANLFSVDAMNNLAEVSKFPENYIWAVQAYENGSSDENIQVMALEAYTDGKGVNKDKVKAKYLKKYIENRARFNKDLGNIIKQSN